MCFMMNVGICEIRLPSKQRSRTTIFYALEEGQDQRVCASKGGTCPLTRGEKAAARTPSGQKLTTVSFIQRTLDLSSPFIQGGWLGMDVD
jgi:hypothetical protein